MKTVWSILLVCGILNAEPVILHAHCTHSFELDAKLERFEKHAEDFGLTLVVDVANKSAYTKGFADMQGKLIMLRADEDSVTMLEPLQDGASVYQWSVRSKKLFVSKNYEWFTQTSTMPIVLTIVCTVR